MGCSLLTILVTFGHYILSYRQATLTEKCYTCTSLSLSDQTPSIGQFPILEIYEDTYTAYEKTYGD